MKARFPMRKAVIGTLTAAMILSGSASVFADGKGKGKEDDGKRSEWQTQMKAKGNIVVNGDLVMNFYDVKGIDWAMRHIASLASSRVFEGYEDGSFKPNQTVSRVEAITAAVRLMGLRDKAESQAEMSTHLNFSDAAKVESKYPWAVGYVAVALENDLFTESDSAVQPEKPADRLWATTLLVKSMKLDAEAKANMNAHLTFRDANKIPAGSVGYVAVAVQKGLIDGYEDNTFRPDRPVTRAELAKLLDVTGDQIPVRQQGTVTGTVTAAVSNNMLTVKEKSGTVVQVKLDPNTIVFRGDQLVTMADLKSGDTVRARLYNGVAVYVEVTNTQNAQFFTVDGWFKSLTRNAQGKINSVTVSTYGPSSVTQSVYNTYNVSPDAVVIGGEINLTVDRAIQLKGANNQVYSIQVK
jgi:hypothetical protein